MKPELLTSLSAWILLCGCAGRMDSDLLQARIREQAAQLSESQQELEQTRIQLKQSLMEAARLKSELDHTSGSAASDASLSVAKLRIHSLTSGGLNKDSQPGDDVVVVQFVPLDSEGHPVQAAGELEFRLSDPLLPPQERELGQWQFSQTECQSHWTRGLTSSGFQFTLPLNAPPRHANLMIKMKYRTVDSRELDAKQIVKVAVGPNHAPASETARRPGQPPIGQPLEDSDESVPLIESPSAATGGADRSIEDPEDATPAPTTPGRAVLHSSNWTDATIPALR